MLKLGAGLRFIPMKDLTKIEIQCVCVSVCVFLSLVLFVPSCIMGKMCVQDH